MSRRFNYTLSILGLLSLLLIFWMFRTRQQGPLVAVHFAGETLGGLRWNPFGYFIITNQSSRVVHWFRAGVESPSNAISVLMDPNLPMGVLQPGAHTNFRALVPHTKGFAFRITVSCDPEPKTFDRMRAKLPSPFPLLDKVWPRTDLSCTVTSRWFHTTADYGATNLSNR